MAVDIKQTKAVNIDASGGAVTDQTVFTVPVGYQAVVTMWFQVNTSGTTGTFTSHWHTKGIEVPFMSAKSLNASEHIEFGGNDMWIVMDSGDVFAVSVSSGNTTSIIISYRLERING